MNFDVRVWSISDVIDLYNNGRLNLMPPYQRNFIWSIKDQEDLVRSINKGYPLPTIFLYERDKGVFEVVDGQQRLRTILNYYNTKVGPIRSGLFGNAEAEEFLNYKLSATILTEVNEDETIEDFYSKVNKAGLKINKPELSKAENFNTSYLNLNQKLASNEEFVQLGLFTDATRLRMNDIDLVSELTALIIRGVSDKKDAVDRLYATDITDEIFFSTERIFIDIVSILTEFNKIYRLSKTRFRQKNDLYTLFHFLLNYGQLSPEILNLLYRALIIISQRISPANDACAPLKDYARNCVTQSNSKDARIERFNILTSLMLGSDNIPSKEQNEVVEYFKLPDDCYLKLEGHNAFDYKKLDNILNYKLVTSI